MSWERQWLSLKPKRQLGGRKHGWVLDTMTGFAFRALSGSSPGLGASTLVWEFGAHQNAHVPLRHHSVLLKIKTFSLGGSVPVCLLTESGLFCDGNLPEISLFHFSSPVCEAIREQNHSRPAAQILWRSKDFWRW